MVTRRLTVVLVSLLVAAACAGRGEDGSAGGTPSGPRPRSTAALTILEPKPGQVVPGGTVTVKVDVQGATILADPGMVSPKPDEGHVHLSLDGKTVSMAYGEEQQIEVKPGVHLLEAEFVAGDHFPFEPRVARKTTFTAE